MNSNLSEIYEVIETMRLKFGWDQTDTIEYLKQSIKEEAIELFESNNTQDLRYELADVLMVSLTLAKMMNVDILEIIKEKAEIVCQRTYD